jgi:oligopeptide/dipeptide ABC transporter ATP-binding protein
VTLSVATDAKILLKVDGLSKHFGPRARFGRTRPVVHAADDVTFEIPRGQALGLVGESGSGKSTIARCVLQVESSDTGSVELDGVDIARLSGRTLRLKRREMQAIFQDPASSLNPRWTIARIIAEPLKAHGWNKERSDARVHELAEQVGLTPAQLRRMPYQLSGGQQQRAGIARALALSPKLIVADEPLSALDVSIQAQVLNLLIKLKTEMDLTFLFISHDLRVTRHLCENIAVCYLGNIVEIGPADELLTNPQHPYTAALISAMPMTLSDVGRKRGQIVLAGDPPSPLNPPSGCRFRTRCFRAQPKCALSAPPLDPPGADHRAACFFPLEAGFLRSVEAAELDVNDAGTDPKSVADATGNQATDEVG